MNFNDAGFLGTNATNQSDLSLILGILVAVILTTGAIMAVRKRYKIHQRIQTTGVVFNLLQVVVVMVGAFQDKVSPGIPDDLDTAYYQVAALHAFAGFLAATFGTFVMLRGNKLVPKFLQFNNYKRFMRTAYVLYMGVTLLGVWTYYTWYVQETSIIVAGDTLDVGEGELAVPIANFAFQPEDLVIPVGTTLVWTNLEGAPHTVTADDGTFVSELMNTGDSFRFTFNEIGEFPYYCELHGSAGGFGMTGVVRVVPEGEAPELVAVVPENIQPVAPSTPADAASLAEFVAGVRMQTAEMNGHVKHVAYGYTTGNIAGIRRHAEHVYNVIVGSQGPQFGDLNGDGSIQNPGDGFGLLANGDQAGYLPAAQTVVNGSDAAATLDSLMGWVEEMRDLALALSQAAEVDSVTESVARLSELADLVEQGRSALAPEPVATEEAAPDPAATEDGVPEPSTTEEAGP